MSNVVNSPPQGNPDAVTEPVSEIPDQLQGKSPQELAAMYQSLEKKLGEQSNELGQLRRLADQTIVQPPPQAEEVDFFEDPEKAVERMIEAKLAPVTGIVSAQARSEVTRQLDAEFPSWKETVASEPFQEWVSKSKVRVGLWKMGDSGDYDAGAELLSTWSDLQANTSTVKANTEKAVKKDRQIRDATTEKGTARIDGRRVLQRADLIELRRTNPDRYNTLLPDIRKAYAEGRVR